MKEYKQDTISSFEDESVMENKQPTQKKVIGIANGKFKIPPDEMFYDDEITEMFEDI